MYLYDSKRVNVLGEYGGIGLPVEGHLWLPDRNWGYVKFSSPREVTDEYVKYALQLKDMVARGFSAAVYTQTTDVEIEVNLRRCRWNVTGNNRNRMFGGSSAKSRTCSCRSPDRRWRNWTSWWQGDSPCGYVC